MANTSVLLYAQTNHMSSKKRLTARRLDWLVHVLFEDVNEKYQISQHIMQAGIAINLRAYHATSAAILKSKECPDSDVRISGSSAAVPSRSTQGVFYTVTLVEGADKPPRCSCQAIGQCWHQVKVLMLKGATEANLLQLIGERFGTPAGGYAALWQAMQQQQQLVKEQHAAAAVGSSAEAAREDIDIPEVQEASAMPMEVDAAGPVCPAVQPRSRQGLPRKTAKQLAHAAVEKLLALGAAWDDESPNWGHVTYQVGLAINGVEKALSAPDMAALQHRHMTLASNPDAPAGNSTRRLVSWIDPCSSKQQRAQPTASRPGKHSLAERVQPFVMGPRPPPRKPTSELEHLQRTLNKMPAAQVSGPAARSTPAPALQQVAASQDSGKLVLLSRATVNCAVPLPPSNAAWSCPAAAEPSQPPPTSGRPQPARAAAAAGMVEMRTSGRLKQKPTRFQDF